LRCPFGCRDHHRRELGRERSRRHYQKPEAKRKKELRNAQRSFPVGPDDVNSSLGVRSSRDVDPSPDVNALPDVDPSRDVGDPAHVDVGLEVSSSRWRGTTADGSPEMWDASAIPAAAVPAVVPAERHEPRASGGETEAEGDWGFPEVVCPELPAAKPCLAGSQRDSVNGERPDTAQGEMPLAGLVLDEASVVNSPILPYVRMVVSLIVEETVSKDQLVADLLKIMRQRSIDNRTRPRYVSRFLNQHPP
jgi:hypothetical protein